MKRSPYHIKTLAASKAVPVNSDRYASTRVPLNKNERTGVPTACKQQGNKTPKCSGVQSYCVLWKKTGMTESKCKLNSSENCFGKFSNQEFVKESLGGTMGNRANDVKQYHKYENK